MPDKDSDKAYNLQAIRRIHNQAYAPWSAQDDEYLRQRFLEGATIDDLVWEFGRQPGGIKSRLRKLGLEAAPVSGPAVAAIPASKVPHWKKQRPRAGMVWTPEEDEKLLHAFERGSAVEEIAASLGRGVFSVEVRLCKLGRTLK